MHPPCLEEEGFEKISRKVPIRETEPGGGVLHRVGQPRHVCTIQGLRRGSALLGFAFLILVGSNFGIKPVHTLVLGAYAGLTAYSGFTVTFAGILLGLSPSCLRESSDNHMQAERSIWLSSSSTLTVLVLAHPGPIPLPVPTRNAPAGLVEVP